MQIPHPDQRRDRMPITKHLQRGVPHTQRVLRRSLPVRVFILQRREYLVQMIVIRVSHIRPQYTIASRFIKAELQVLSAEIQIGLGAGQTEHQTAVCEVRQLVAGRGRHRRRDGGRRRPPGVR